MGVPARFITRDNEWDSRNVRVLPQVAMSGFTMTRASPSCNNALVTHIITHSSHILEQSTTVQQYSEQEPYSHLKIHIVRTYVMWFLEHILVVTILEYISLSTRLSVLSYTKRCYVKQCKYHNKSKKIDIVDFVLQIS